MAEIKLSNVTHSYDGKTNAVEDINIIFKDKTTNALLGPSGCGKTTTLKIISGLLKPTKGRVIFDKVDVTDLPPERRNVGMVFQFPVVYSMTVLENLMFPLLNQKTMSKEDKRRVALEVAEMLDIKDILNEHAPKLGPADRQRVALGRLLVKTMIQRPTVILFDEPLSSIEPEKRHALKRLIKEVQKKSETTTVYVTHDQTEALTFAEKIAIMNKGRIVQFDTVENIYSKPKDTFVGFFVGFPGMNILEGVVKGDVIDFVDFQVKIPPGAKLPPRLQRVKLGIRPEHIEISLESKKGEEGWIPLECQLYENLGKGFGIAHLASKNQKLKARSEVPVRPGSTVWVRFIPEYIRLFDEEGKLIEF